MGNSSSKFAVKKNAVQNKQVKQQKNQMKKVVWITAASILAVFAIVWISVSSTRSNTNSSSFKYAQLPMLGDSKAPVKVVELGDFKCPACQYFSQTIEPQLKKDYVDKGLISMYFMNYTFLGPDSVTAAIAAQSVFHQNNAAFWAYYDALYKYQGKETVQWATPQFFVQLAEQEKLPIDYNKLQQDIASQAYEKEVKDQNALGNQLGVTGTPTLFINGKKVSSDKTMDYQALKAVLDSAIKDAK